MSIFNAGLPFFFLIVLPAHVLSPVWFAVVCFVVAVSVDFNGFDNFDAGSAANGAYSLLALTSITIHLTLRRHFVLSTLYRPPTTPGDSSDCFIQRRRF